MMNKSFFQKLILIVLLVILIVGFLSGLFFAAILVGNNENYEERIITTVKEFDPLLPNEAVSVPSETPQEDLKCLLLLNHFQHGLQANKDAI